MIVILLGAAASDQDFWLASQLMQLPVSIRRVTMELSAVYPKNRMNNFWFDNPTQLLIQGQ
jgi:hypothetical protein